MRYKDPGIFQANPAATGKERTLRLLGDGCAWLGEAFIGLSFAVLSQVRKSEISRHHQKLPERVLLSVDGEREDQMQKKTEVKFLCKGCYRDVVLILEVEGVPRCEDCLFVAQDKQNRFLKAGLN